MPQTQQVAQESLLAQHIAKVKAEEASGKVSKPSLIDLAYCYLTARCPSKEEGYEAVALLAKYRLWRLANRHYKYVAQSYLLIEKEKSKSYLYRCVRCGLPLSKPKSVARGCGDVCNRKHVLKENVAGLSGRKGEESL